LPLADGTNLFSIKFIWSGTERFAERGRVAVAIEGFRARGIGRLGASGYFSGAALGKRRAGV
jgi:hypothetical protein